MCRRRCSILRHETESDWVSYHQLSVNETTRSFASIWPLRHNDARRRPSRHTQIHCVIMNVYNFCTHGALDMPTEMIKINNLYQIFKRLA
jgi:hypothetical protein